VAVALTRGVPVRGRVTEGAGGKTVAGARVDFWAKGLKLPEGVRRPRHVQTGADGVFRALLPPASWHLLVNAAKPDYVFQKIAVDKVVDGKVAGKEDRYFRPDAWHALDLKPGTGAQEVVIRLERAPLLRGRVVGPDGKPVAAARLLAVSSTPVPAGASPDGTNQFLRRVSLDLTGTPGAFRQWMIGPAPSESPPGAVEIRDGTFSLPAHDPEGTYRLFFLGADGKLGGITQVQAKQARGEPVTVHLAPCGSARARFVDAMGKPAADHQVEVQLLVSPRTQAAPAAGTADAVRNRIDLLLSDGWELDREVPDAVTLRAFLPIIRKGGPRTDAEGRLTLPGLIPGAAYRISGVVGGTREFRVEAGQAIDLGELRLPPTKEAPKAKAAPAGK
jgi:hypothetical protein